MLHEGDEYVLTNDTSLHLRRPTTSESADIKQSFTMQNNNENKSAGYTTAMFVYFCNSIAECLIKCLISVPTALSTHY